MRTRQLCDWRRLIKARFQPLPACSFHSLSVSIENVLANSRPDNGRIMFVDVFTNGTKASDVMADSLGPLALAACSNTRLLMFGSRASEGQQFRIVDRWPHASLAVFRVEPEHLIPRNTIKSPVFLFILIFFSLSPTTGRFALTVLVKQLFFFFFFMGFFAKV